MFIGREHELSVLNKLYMSDKFEFAVIYGRRRVGKLRLSISLSVIKKQSILWGLKVTLNRIWKTSAKILWSVVLGFRQIRYFYHFRRHWNMYFKWLKRNA